jgi:nucleotide-binding universal stress UspA family protein
MYERILVPLDGSKVGESALESVEALAVKLAPTTAVEVILLNVLSDVTFDFLTDNPAAQLPHTQPDMKMMRQASAGYLETLADRLRKKGMNVTTMVAEGNAAEEIIRAAHSKDANLIAMSSHGRSGLRRWALGSITDKVLHESDIPVLTIRARTGG